MATNVSTPTKSTAPELALGEALPEDHPTATIYLDESGVIKADRFFGIGCLRVDSESQMTQTLHRHRQVLEYREELHWSRFGKAVAAGTAFDLAVAALDAFFELDDVSFCCTLFDRQDKDVTRSYKDAWKAYEGLSCLALKMAIGQREVVSVLADHLDTPAHVRFENDVRSGVNREMGRLAITGVTRVHSHAVDGLQLADLLLGAVMFDFRQGGTRGALDPTSQKGQLSTYLLDRCGIHSFRPGGKEVQGKIRVEMRRRTKRTHHRGQRGGDSSGLSGHAGR
jgi:Protein of unknown function (DUF3800)